MQGEDPPFRLAAWVLREEGFSVHIVERAEDAAAEFPETPPDLIVFNAAESPPQHLQSVMMLRGLAMAAPIVHLGSEGAQDATTCDCAQIIPAPHSGPALVDAANRLLA